MPIIPIFTCVINGATEADLNQWCSHNLSNTFRVWTEPRYGLTLAEMQDPAKRERLLVRVIGNKDRFRLRESFDIAKTIFGREYLSDGDFVEK